MKLHYVVVVLTVLASLAFAQDTTRVLWLGNSLIVSTYSRVNEVNQFAAERGVKMVNQYGAYQYDAENGWNLVPGNHDLIRNSHWDYVVVQVFGTSGCNFQSYALHPLDSIVKVMRLWDSLIDSAGAKTVFYMPWGIDSYKPVWDSINQSWKPDHMDTAVATLSTLCTEMNAAMFPVGMGQFEVQKRDKSIRLFTDWIHGSAEMGYMGGLICFAALTGQDPRGMSNLYSLDSQTVFFLQQVAWQSVFKPDQLPFGGLWTRPATVDGMNLYAKGNPTSLEQYLAADIVADLHFTDASTVTSTNGLLFRSLTPSVMTVNHFGRAIAVAPGTAKIEARAENVLDTLTLTITASTATYDSIRISPRAFSGYVTDRFKFTATGYAWQQGQLIQVDFTDAAAWISSDTATFALLNGTVIKKTAQGGPMWAAVEKNGLKDTVHFTMLQDLSLLMRINFQDKDTSYSDFWKHDFGRPYTDSMGYGWVNAPATRSYTASDDINFNDSFFLTSTVQWASAAAKDSAVEATYKINCHDGDYMVRMALGHPYFSPRTSWVRYGTDTLFKYTNSQPWSGGKLIAIKTDTITVRGEQGIFLDIRGPIAYLVVATSAGVAMDSVAFDTKPTLPTSGLALSSPVSSPEALLASPNPFNQEVLLRINGQSPSQLRIFDVRGRMVADLTGQAKNNYVHWNAAGHTAGIYLIKMKTGNRTITRKIVLSR